MRNSCKGSGNGTWCSKGSEKQGKSSWKEYITPTSTRAAEGGGGLIFHKFYSVNAGLKCLVDVGEEETSLECVRSRLVAMGGTLGNLSARKTKSENL